MPLKLSLSHLRCQLSATSISAVSRCRSNRLFRLIRSAPCAFGALPTGQPVASLTSTEGAFWCAVSQRRLLHKGAFFASNRSQNAMGTKHGNRGMGTEVNRLLFCILRYFTHYTSFSLNMVTYVPNRGESLINQGFPWEQTWEQTWEQHGNRHGNRGAFLQAHFCLLRLRRNFCVCSHNLVPIPAVCRASGNSGYPQPGCLPVHALVDLFQPGLMGGVSG